MAVNLAYRNGRGERLFDGGGTDLHRLTLASTVAAPGVAHLHFIRR